MMSKLSQVARVIGFAVMITVPSAITFFAVKAIFDDIEWSKGSAATIVAAFNTVFVLWLIKTLLTKEGTTK